MHELNGFGFRVQGGLKYQSLGAAVQGAWCALSNSRFGVAGAWAYPKGPRTQQSCSILWHGILTRSLLGAADESSAAGGCEAAQDCSVFRIMYNLYYSITLRDYQEQCFYYRSKETTEEAH